LTIGQQGREFNAQHKYFKANKQSGDNFAAPRMYFGILELFGESLAALEMTAPRTKRSAKIANSLQVMGRAPHY